MIIQFKDRIAELKELHDVLRSDKFELFIIYGRRRIGKTELVLHATKNNKRIYYLATGQGNLDRFYNECLRHDKRVSTLRKDWEVLFDFLKDAVDVVIIDEFQNIIHEDKNILHLFQSIVDVTLKNSKLKIILLGSSVSMVTSKILGYKSPLYGRRTASLNLKTVSFFELGEFFPKTKLEELMNIYGFADGIPFYLIRIDKSFWNWLSFEIRKERSFLRDEVDFIMKYEFDDVGTYKLILEAIAFDNTKLNDIRNFIKIKRTDLSPYLRNLIEVGFIERKVPITENIKSREGRYYLSDNFLRFWFKFIYPNLSSLEEGIFDVNMVKRGYNNYLGFVFEKIAREFLIRKKLFAFDKIGKWWYKDREIDIVAFRSDGEEILFGECKWKRNINPEEISHRLVEKSKDVRWKNNKRKESLVLFAKSFNRKIKEFEGRKVYCFDLKDFKKLMREYTR